MCVTLKKGMILAAKRPGMKMTLVEALAAGYVPYFIRIQSIHEVWFEVDFPYEPGDARVKVICLDPHTLEEKRVAPLETLRGINLKDMWVVPETMLGGPDVQRN